MIIRCPQCEHSRSVNEGKIPATAELATCPKCKHRFRFRTVGSAVELEESLFSSRDGRSGAKEGSAPDRRTSPESASAPPGLEVQRPQGAVREAAARRGDIWDAVDTLHHRWQAQMDQHVTEVITPRPVPMPDVSDEEAAPEEKARHEDSAALEKATAALRSRLGGEPARKAESPADSPLAPVREAAPAPKAAVYPYGENGPRPEERVEQDMRLLREAPDARPVRNLGSLSDYPDIAFSSSDGESPSFTDGEPEDGLDEDMAENAIPWENPAAHGWAKAFMSTLHGVMFRGPAFFSRFSAGGSLGPGYLFFLILGYVTILGSLLWSQALAALLPGTIQGLSNRIALPVLLLLAPIALGLMLLFVTGCIRVILLLFAPEKSVFPLVYRVVSYSMAPFVLSIVPFVGPAVGAAWFIAALITGCRNALKLSWKLSVFAPLPPAAMLLGGLVWYFL